MAREACEVWMRTARPWADTRDEEVVPPCLGNVLGAGGARRHYYTIKLRRRAVEVLGPARGDQSVAYHAAIDNRLAHKRRPLAWIHVESVRAARVKVRRSEGGGEVKVRYRAAGTARSCCTPARRGQPADLAHLVEAQRLRQCNTIEARVEGSVEPRPLRCSHVVTPIANAALAKRDSCKTTCSLHRPKTGGVAHGVELGTAQRHLEELGDTLHLGGMRIGGEGRGGKRVGSGLR